MKALRGSLITVLFLLGASLAGCSSGQEVGVTFKNPDGSSSPQITAEVVSTPESRSLGLMYRKALPENSGMLFIFPDEAPRSFWMKNTYLELDIVFLDRALQVVSIQEHAVPLTESARPSEGPAQYVLEIGGGRASGWGIRKGSQLMARGELTIPTK